MIDCSDYLIINQSRLLYLAMKFILCAQLMFYIVTHTTRFTGREKLLCAKKQVSFFL